MPLAAALPTRRADLLAALAQPVVYDLAVVGGGATGLGVALDAAARGLRVVLLEAHDFAKGTSSRSTKLVHGGVRYLAHTSWRADGAADSPNRATSPGTAARPARS